MLRAIQLMGWPLDMICSVDIWATQDIPAELPPMVKFKDEYDQKVLDWFGVPVTRLCATKRSQNVNAERERESGPNGCPTQMCSTQCQMESMQAQSRVSPEQQPSLGARNSKWIRLTYEDIFYRQISTDRKRERERERGGETSRRTAVPESTDSRKYWELGVSQNSNDQQHRIPESELPLVYGRTQKSRFYGFPISPGGNWCTQLKTAPCEAPERGAENKYRSLLGYCGG